MNIEGNNIIWKENNIGITNTRKGFSVYKYIITKNEDGSEFRFWSYVDSLDELDAAILFAKEIQI